jgi:[ribosomal protein S5]-alanine N-acetyltransferase
MSKLNKKIPKEIVSENLKLQILSRKYAGKVLDYYLRNQTFFKQWEPLRDDNFYTLKYHQKALKSGLNKTKKGSQFRFFIFAKDNSDLNEIIGILSFSSIVKGPFLSCFVGYSMENTRQNNGYMTEALKAGIRFIFETVGLHRIEANIMPRNAASIRVVTKLGFRNEGLSPKYLKINGLWEDHVHMVLINKELE